MSVRFELHANLTLPGSRAALCIRQTTRTYEEARAEAIKLLRSAYGPGPIVHDNWRFVHAYSPNGLTLPPLTFPPPVDATAALAYRADAVINVFVTSQRANLPPLGFQRPSAMLYRPQLDRGERALQALDWCIRRWPTLLIVLMILVAVLP